MNKQTLQKMSLCAAFVIFLSSTIALFGMHWVLGCFGITFWASAVYKACSDIEKEQENAEPKVDKEVVK